MITFLTYFQVVAICLASMHRLFFDLPLWHINHFSMKKILLEHALSQFSHSVVSNSPWPHELQHARLPCPSPSPGVHPNSCPSSRWCHPAISSSVVPFSSCPQSLPASGSFPISQLFTSGSQSTGVSALASFLPKNTQGWSPSEWTGWISLQSKGLSVIQYFSLKIFFCLVVNNCSMVLNNT